MTEKTRRKPKSMKTKILIADDNEEFVRELSDYLGGKDEYDIVAPAYDGEEALEKINANRPDVYCSISLCPSWTATECSSRSADRQRSL